MGFINAPNTTGGAAALSGEFFSQKEEICTAKMGTRLKVNDGVLKNVLLHFFLT